VSVRKYYQCIPKTGRRSNFKPEMYSRFIQRRGGTIVSLFFCQKTVIIFLENIISPSQRTSRCRNWAISPLAANIYCCFTPCSFVYILDRPYTVQVYSCTKMAIALASKDSTMAKHRIYLRRNSE
jgi:hypothetical protein